MAVTTANTLKLSDVCLEIYGSSSTSGRTLATCHTDATGTFNITYAVIGADTLLDFRGYVHGVPTTSFSMSTFGNANATTVCGYSLNTTRYHDGGAASPTNGDVVYVDAAGTTPLNGGNTYWKINAFARCLINPEGLCSSIAAC